jgi:hypothetical protein
VEYWKTSLTTTAATKNAKNATQTNAAERMRELNWKDHRHELTGDFDASPAN